MSGIFFTIPGDAVGKGRPRFAKRGNSVKAYTPEKTVRYESLVANIALEAMSGRTLYEQAMSCEINVHVAPPASWSKKKRAEALNGDIYPTIKPDLDNIAKGILDALNGIVYKDDKQVIRCVLSKRYAEEAKVIVQVISIGGKE